MTARFTSAPRRIVPVLVLTACLAACLAALPVPASARQVDPAFAAAQRAWEDGDPDEALAQLDRLGPGSRSEAESLFLEALVQQALGHTDRAARRIADAVRKDPGNLDYLELQLELGFPNELTVFRRVKEQRLVRKMLELDSLNVAAHSHAGFLEMRRVLAHRDNYAFGKPDELNKRHVDLHPIENPPGIPPPGSEPGDATLFKTLDLRRIDPGLGTVQYLGEEADASFPLVVGHLYTVLERDPENRDAARHLAAVYMAGRIDPFLETLVDSLQIYQARSPWTEFIAGYLAQRQKRYSDADQHFERAFYLSPDSLRRVFENPALVMTEDQRERFAAAGDSAASIPAEHAFWAARDVRYLTPFNERWTEHIARVVYSELVFTSYEGAYSGIESDRGQIFVRYGLPTLDIFVRGMMFDCGSHTYTKFHVFDYPSRRIIFGLPPMTQDNEYILYAPCAQAFRSTALLGMHADYVIHAGDLIREQPESYEHEPAATRVEMPWLTSRFRSETDPRVTDVVVAAGVQVPTRPDRGALSMPLETGVFLIDPSSGVAAEDRRSPSRLDRNRIHELDNRFLWTTTSTLQAPPGEYELSVEFETAESGAVTGFSRSDLTVKEPEPGSLGMSDIMLAYRVTDRTLTASTDGAVVRRGYEIDPAPVGAFSTEAPLYIYFETYEKTVTDGNAAYRVTVALAPRDDGTRIGRILDRLRPGDQSEEGVSTAFEGSSPSRDDGHYLILEPSTEEPGDYTLAVRITDLATGESVESARSVVLY